MSDCKLLYYHNQLFNTIRSKLSKDKHWGIYNDIIHDLETKAGYFHTKPGSKEREKEKSSGAAIWGQFTAFVDRKDDIQGVWHMDHNMPYINQDDDYPEARIPFEDIMFEVACDFAKTGKTIDVMWSGGIDSTASLLALHNVCPKQIRVIMSEGSIDENPTLYSKLVKHLDHVISDGNITGESDCLDHIIGSCNEADALFGGKMTTDPIDSIPEKEKQTQWKALQRYFTAAKSWKHMLTYTGDRVNPDNYKPFYCHSLIEKYCINKCNDGEMDWYNALPAIGKDGYPVNNEVDEYLKAKKELREFIGKHFDTGWAASKPKVASIEHGQKFFWNEKLNRRSIVYRNLGITSDGLVINKDNVEEFDLFKYLNPSVLALKI
mgnify:CR=1 FL=1